MARSTLAKMTFAGLVHLRWQARCRRATPTCADKDSPATVESMVEDYIHNAKLTARTQRNLRKIRVVILLQ
jgi:hypothetical protein